MRHRRRDFWSFAAGAILTSLLVLKASVISADEMPRRFLVIYEQHSTLPANIKIAAGIEAKLAEALPTGREIYSVYLESARFPEMTRTGRLLPVLKANFAELEIDAIFVFGSIALSFAIENRAILAPEAPIVFGAISEASLDNLSLPSGVGGVLATYDIGKAVEFAMQLQPEARQIAVMSGDSNFDRSWALSARNALDEVFADLPVSYISQLPLEGYVEAARQFDPDTILLILSVLQDATGQRFNPRDSAREIAAASGAPTYAMYSTFVEGGLTGGRGSTFHEIGAAVAVQGLEAIGKGADSALPIIENPATNVVNWPQLERFGIDETRVPDDTARFFYAPSVWQRYQREIAFAAVVLLLQTATIGALIIQMRRRRRMSADLESGRLELAHAARVSQLGGLSGAIAHELNQPLTAILANAEAGSRMLGSETPDIAEVAEILSDIASEDQRAAGIIVQLRRLMKEGEVTLETVDLNEVVSATLDLSHSELVTRRTAVEFSKGQAKIAVMGNMTQLQQIVLNLVLNAADSMKDMDPDKRRIVCETAVLSDGTRRLAVTDHGPGLSAEYADKVFRPFVTSKPDGLGLGLSICVSIAKAHGGTLAFDQTVASGAQIVLSLPNP